MIEVNLLPEELRNRVIKPVKPAVSGNLLKPGPQLFILSIPLIFALLITIHIFIGLAGIVRSVRLNSLKGKWEKVALQRKALEDFNAEHALVSGDAQAIQRLTLDRVGWSEKLYKLSLSLPAGVWFELVSVSGKDFYLRGKAVTVDKTEVSLIRNFVDEIKNQPQFVKNFNSLELTSIQKGIIGAYEVADFSLTGSLK